MAEQSQLPNDFIPLDFLILQNQQLGRGNEIQMNPLNLPDAEQRNFMRALENIIHNLPSGGSSDESDDDDDVDDDDDDFEEEGQIGEIIAETPEKRQVIVEEMYNQMYQSLDRIRQEISNQSRMLKLKKPYMYTKNIERRNRPIPIRLTMLRFERLADMFDKISQRVVEYKRLVKQLDRNDAKLFYPANRSMFRNGAYAAFVKEARVLPIPADANQSVCICCQEPATVSIQRSCLWCEGHGCTCREFIFCEKCSVYWYWRSSDHYKKTFATCPTCRGEYCLEDIVINHFTPSVTPSIQEQIDIHRRRLCELEGQLSSSSPKRQKTSSPEEVDLEQVISMAESLSPIFETQLPDENAVMEE